MIIDEMNPLWQYLKLSEDLGIEVKHAKECECEKCTVG